MFCCCFNYLKIFLVISVRPVISTSTRTIFTKFARLVELWPPMNDLVIFSIPQGMLPWQPILWAKSTSIPHLVVRIAFARAAPPAYDKKGNCCVGRRQTNYLIRWTQAMGISGWALDSLFPASSYIVFCFAILQPVAVWSIHGHLIAGQLSAGS